MLPLTFASIGRKTQTESVQARADRSSTVTANPVMTELNMEPEISDRDLLLAFDRSFDPPSECGDQRCRDSFPEFIYIVVVPAAVLLLVIHVILFSLLVCCCVKRRRKPVAESEEQLAMYEAIRRASAGVRRMSHGATTPLLDSRSGSMSLVRNDHRRRGFRPRDSCHSAPGTLQRHRNRESAHLQETPPPPPPPPPYGMPPDYPLGDDDDAFLGPGIPMQEFPPQADEPEPQQNGHHQHPSHRRHHRRQRPYSAANGYMTR